MMKRSATTTFRHRIDVNESSAHPRGEGSSPSSGFDRPVQSISLLSHDVGLSDRVRSSRSSSETLQAQEPGTLNGTTYTTRLLPTEKPVVSEPKFSPYKSQRASISLSPPSSAICDDLGYVIDVMYADCRKRLHESPPTIEKYFTTSSASAGSIKVLQQCSSGVIPEDLGKRVLLAFIAFAAAYVVHHENTLYRWDPLLHDVLRLDDNIADPLERKNFRVVLRNLLPPPVGPCENYYPNLIGRHLSWVTISSVASTQVETRSGQETGSTLCKADLAYIEPAPPSAFNEPTAVNQTHLSQRQRPIFIACIQFLALLEVMDPRMNMPTPQKLCDEHYGAKIAAWQSQLCDKLNGSGVQIHDSPVSPHSSTSSYTQDESPLGSVATPFSTPPIFPSGDVIWAPTCPTNCVGHSISELPGQAPSDRLEAAPAQVSTLNQTQQLFCGICFQVFQGEPQDQRSNLSRHMNCQHDPEPKHKCQVAGCNAKYGRSDTLRAHCWNAHRLVVSKTKRQGRKKSDSS